MSEPSQQDAAVDIRLADYQPPSWLCPRIGLEFDLGADFTEVTARLHVEPNPDGPAAPLRLDGEGLELLSVSVDGKRLGEEDYELQPRTLLLPSVDRAAVVETRVRIHPAANTRLEGLYASGGMLLTQCEAEGFRRITFFPDRPDVLSVYDVTLRADASRYPELLANGDPVESGKLDDGRHWARWHDPHPKPCYLFALVAGELDRLSAGFTTAEGRDVTVNIWAAKNDVPRCRHARDSVLAAMRWDEQRFGRYYDLDVFNVVAANDFNMGAMENKGLNIFNARYILADPDSATDTDYLNIEAVIGHEYFHNWSGNRVTLRDWFQLSLKEGLTVFRDQEFSADLHSRGLKRIEDVRLLKARQFAEDAGPLAHPVRPASYQRIDNFYTVTVYEKGAEVVRMLHTLLGEQAFRAGLDRYFADNDGRAATVEDFLVAMTTASGRDLSQFARWYAQAGTPELRIEADYDADARHYRLSFRQRNPVAAEAAAEGPLHIPLRYALYDADNQPINAAPEGDAVVRDGLIELTGEYHELRFGGLDAAPLASFLQGLSAPVRLRFDADVATRIRLLHAENDALSRWEAAQGLWLHFLLNDEPLSSPAASAWQAALRGLLTLPVSDPAFVAECLTPPDFGRIADEVETLDFDRLWSRREALLDAVAADLEAPLSSAYDAFRDDALAAYSPTSVAARRIRGACLALLSRRADGASLAAGQYRDATTLTERLSALRALIHHDAPDADRLLSDFRGKAGDDPLRTDHWLALVATRPREDTLDRLKALVDSPLWLPNNPNRVRALVDRFARGNPPGFHRKDGAGYAWVLERIAAADRDNPQLAARLLTAFESSTKLDPTRRRHVLAGLDALASGNHSRLLDEVLQRLHQAHRRHLP